MLASYAKHVDPELERLTAQLLNLWIVQNVIVKPEPPHSFTPVR